jgi:sarcosine oxidase, subunit beta
MPLSSAQGLAAPRLPISSPKTGWMWLWSIDFNPRRGVRQSGRDPAELPLARAAVAMWVTLAEELGAETHYRRSGNLRVARDEAEIAMIREVVQSQAAAGLDITLLPDNRAVREVAPAVSERALLASYCTSDGSADPTSTVLALVRAGAAGCEVPVR